MIADIPEYNGPGVYALIDSNGKKYIGSSMMVADRIKRHNDFFKLCRNYGHTGYLNRKIETSIAAGIPFRAELIEACPVDISKKDLRQREGIALLRAGGLANTYNVCPIPVSPTETDSK